MALKLRLTDTKTERLITKLQNRIHYLEREILVKQRQTTKVQENMQDLERLYKNATKRANALQLTVNRLKKELGNKDEYELTIKEK